MLKARLCFNRLKVESTSLSRNWFQTPTCIPLQLVLLTAGPALWLTAIGQGHLINTPGPEDNEGGMMLGACMK